MVLVTLVASLSWIFGQEPSSVCCNPQVVAFSQEPLLFYRENLERCWVVIKVILLPRTMNLILVSGPHVDPWHPWWVLRLFFPSQRWAPCRPMSHISAIFGTDDDREIMNSLALIVNVGLHLFVLVDPSWSFPEYEWTGLDPWIAIYLQGIGLYEVLVRLGK